MLGLNIPVALPGLEDQNVVVKIPGLFSAARLVVGGRPAPHGAGKGASVLEASDGTTKTVVLKRGLVDPVPRLECDGVSVPVTRPFGWREHLSLWLPIIPLYLGGSVAGALLGGSAAYVNARILRQPGSWSPALRPGWSRGAGGRRHPLPTADGGDGAARDDSGVTSSLDGDRLRRRVPPAAEGLDQMDAGGHL